MTETTAKHVLYDEIGRPKYFSEAFLKEFEGFIRTSESFRIEGDDHEKDYALGLMIHIERIRKMVPKKIRNKYMGRVGLSEGSFNILEEKCQAFI